VYAQAGRGPKLTGTTLGALQQHHFTSRKSCRQIATFVKLNAGLGGTMLFVSLSATRRRQHSATTLDVRGRAIQSNLLPLQRLISNHIRVAKKTAQLGSLCVQRSIMLPQSSGIRCPASGACLLGLPRALTALKTRLTSAVAGQDVYLTRKTRGLPIFIASRGAPYLINTVLHHREFQLWRRKIPLLYGNDLAISNSSKKSWGSLVCKLRSRIERICSTNPKEYIFYSALGS
jgi:hypothetical protein